MVMPVYWPSLAFSNVSSIIEETNGSSLWDFMTPTVTFYMKMIWSCCLCFCGYEEALLVWNGAASFLKNFW